MKLKTLLLAIIGSMALFVSSPAWSDEALDINKATVEQLQTIKGIGPKTAAAIVDYRNAHGAFKSVDALTAVKGIGSRKLERIRSRIKAGKEAMLETSGGKLASINNGCRISITNVSTA